MSLNLCKSVVARNSVKEHTSQSKAGNYGNAHRSSHKNHPKNESMTTIPEIFTNGAAKKNKNSG